MEPRLVDVKRQLKSAGFVLADKGYISNQFRSKLTSNNIILMTPAKILSN